MASPIEDIINLSTFEPHNGWVDLPMKPATPSKTVEHPRTAIDDIPAGALHRIEADFKETHPECQFEAHEIPGLLKSEPHSEVSSKWKSTLVRICRAYGVDV